MEERVHFYSTYDMSIPINIERADMVIEKYKQGWRPESINDVIELYNIWLFVENNIRKTDWDDDKLGMIKNAFKTEVIRYFSKLSRETWAAAYNQIEIGERQYFWEIIDRFGIDGLIDENTLKESLSDNEWELRERLQYERLVNRYQQIITILLKENESTAEWLLQEFVEENSLHDQWGIHWNTCIICPTEG